MSSSRLSSSKPRGQGLRRPACCGGQVAIQRDHPAMPSAKAVPTHCHRSSYVAMAKPKRPPPRLRAPPPTPPPPPRASTLCEHCGREFPVSERALHSRSRWCAICFLLEDCHRAWTEEYGPVPPQVRDRFENLLTMALCELRTFRAAPLGWPVAVATAATSSSTAAPPLD